MEECVECAVTWAQVAPDIAGILALGVVGWAFCKYGLVAFLK